MDSTSNVRGLPPNLLLQQVEQLQQVCTDYKIHTFTGPGTFTVTNAGLKLLSGSNIVSYLVTAGGAGGGGSHDNPG